jgi:peptidoglycan/LPS O-acetylase OafA/YrhL
MLGVELFFIISGFVILMSLEKVKSLGEFALHRAARLYPAYWFSVAIAGTAMLWLRQSDLVTIAINATMLQAFSRQESGRSLLDPRL